MMIRATKIPSNCTRAGFAAIIALLLSAMPALAAEPVFPTGSRLGLVPPPGMVRSRTFEGFEDPDKNAVILFAAMPAAAYGELDKSMVPEALQKQGIEIDKREPIELGSGKGFLLSGKQTSDNAGYRKWLLVAPVGDITALVTVQIKAAEQDKDNDTTYSDSVVRTALATLAVRASVPDAERLSLLPFTVGDLAGFRIDDIVPGSALMLVDGPADQGTDPSGPAHKTHFLIAAMSGGPNEAADRANFARVTFGQIGGIKDIHIQDAEPLRLNNQAGYETLAKAKEGRTDADIMVVQWLRFGTGGFMQMIGIVPAELWHDAFTRLRAVRDSVDPK
jgi:hypothetical protein